MSARGSFALETDHNETMDSLIGKKIADWGTDGAMYHMILDDGRVLIFMGLGIIAEGSSAVH